MSGRVCCFCNSNIPWGGGEKWHLEAALSMAGRGRRILFICHPRSELFKRAQRATGLTVVPLPLGRLSFLNPFMHGRLTRLFRREGVDTLIMNLPADLKAAGPAARAAGVRQIIYRRGSALPVRDTQLNRHLYGRVLTRLIVNSEATRRQVLINNHNLISPERISVLPNGIDVRAFDEALSAAEHSVGLLPVSGGTNASGSRPFVFGNAGRLNAQKGQHLLLHLCRRLLDSGLDCAVIIAGTGERESELKALADRLKLEGRAVFPGFLENLAPFWHSIDLFVLSSLWEGFGSVLIEAMLAHRPVFAFAVSNIPELVFEDGPNRTGNGRLFPLPAEELANCPDFSRKSDADALLQTGAADNPREPYADLDGLALAIRELAANPEQAERMGQSGRDFALRFSQDACMDRLEALIDERAT